MLNKVLDPILFGFAAKNNYQATMKSVTKRNAEEKVGVMCLHNNKYHVVEYIDISEEDMRKTKSETDNTLVYRHGSILVFCFGSEMLKAMLKKTPSERGSDVYHNAWKKVEYWDGGKKVVPTEPNAWKFELFAQNFFKNVHKGRFGLIEVERKDEFAPVKNADKPIEEGVEIDSPISAKLMLLDETTRWLEAAGFTLTEEARNNVELSFLFSYRGERLSELKEKLGTTLIKPGYIDEHMVFHEPK